MNSIDYARQRAAEALSKARTAVLVTCGPAGLLAGEFSCEAIGLELYLLVPQTSDHLFNLEQDAAVALVSAAWELKGEAQIVSPAAADIALALMQAVEAKWCALVRVAPRQVHIRREAGWGNIETIDLGVR
jgi:hypothetical protein